MYLKFSLLVFVALLFLLCGSATLGGTDFLLGSSHSSLLVEKPRTVPWSDSQDPVSNPRQGGEDMDTAFPIPSLPYAVSGTTCGYNVNFSEECGSWSGGPDVVYSFIPGSDMVITVDMCGSSYDTFIWIYDDQFNMIACNDDFYFNGDTCGTYVSKIEQAALQQGMTYYIFVAGYSSCGGYQMTVTEYEPCVLDCAGFFEGEPTLHDGYVDEYNSGCLMPNYPFQSLSGELSGELEFCGKGGWYLDSGGNITPDFDWLIVTVGSTGVVEWTLEAEQVTAGFLLQAGDCDNFIPPLDSFVVLPCSQPSITMQGVPGEVLWLVVRASENSPPTGFVGHEYNYICTFTGLDQGSVATENLPWGGIKSRYR